MSFFVKLRLLLPVFALLSPLAWAEETAAKTPVNPQQRLAPVHVMEPRHEPAAAPVPTGPMRVLLGFGLPSGLTMPTPLDAVVVTASRTPQAFADVAVTARVLDELALRTIPAATLDGALRSVPGFSLFRRSDSLTANPTAQGVSLRGLGPSGASRSLVLLDGVPLNDPFGGWVAWTKLPREALARAEIIPGGGATAWGNAALGGVVQLFLPPPRAQMAIVDRSPQPRRTEWRGTAGLTALLGDFHTRSAEVALIRPIGKGIVQVLARDFSTDGFSLVAPERRGTIDVAAASAHRWLMLRWRYPIAQNLEATVTARGYEENRNNGTPYQRNRSRETFASVTVEGQPSDAFGWQAAAYVQDQSFASTFSAVNATRTAETPASDQFAVPAVAFGGAWTGTWQHPARARTSAGLDARYVRGETRENFTFTNGAFTRQRVAGGTQSIAGIFALHERSVAPSLRVTFGARGDLWRETDGRRNEVDRTSGTVLRDDRYEDQRGAQFSPSAGLVWTPNHAWRVRASAQHAFRRPTLNELYRPFRVGPNVTEANSALGTERVVSGEFGVEWNSGELPKPAAEAVGTAGERIQPLPRRLSLGAVAYWNELRDAVSNVTLVRGPGTFPIVGFVAAGGIGRQRLNLDQARVRGLELSARWAPRETLSVDAAALFNDAVVQRAAVAPLLVGRRLAQVPRRSAAVGASWRAPGQITLAPRLRWIGRQFEDDENTLRLGEVVVLDLGVSRPLNHHAELFLTVENLTDARIETGRTVDGIVNTGTPRFAFGGVRLAW